MDLKGDLVTQVVSGAVETGETVKAVGTAGTTKTTVEEVMVT